MTVFTDLVAGYRRFHEHGWVEQHDRWSELSQGQSPKVMVIACSDSRTDPATVFDVSPGEIFVVRNVSNLVPPFELGGGRHGVSAALEFAVTQLKVEEIVVMGHGTCGGVHASLTGRFTDAKPGEGGFIARWIDMLDEARDRIVAQYGTGDEAANQLELETVRVSLANLRSFPCVREAEAEGRLALHGAWFSIRGGVLWVMGDDGEFAPAV